MKIFDKHAFLGYIILEFAKRGVLKIPFDIIFECTSEFNNILLSDNIKINLILTHYDIERFANKHFNCVNVKEGSNILKITGEELASIFFASKFKGEGRYYEKYLEAAIDSIFETHTNQLID